MINDVFKIDVSFSLTFQTTQIRDRISKPICREWADAPEIPGSQPHRPDENCTLHRRAAVSFCPRIKIQYCTRHCRIYYRHIFAI